MDSAGRELDPSLLKSAHSGLRAAPATAAGRPRLYSYDNLKSPPADTSCSCGHAAIATLLDFYDRVPLPPNLRSERGQGLADDGRLHFPNETFVRKVFTDHPPVNFLGLVRFVTREVIQQAMHQAHLRTGESWPPLLGSDESRFAIARKSLCDWMAQTGLPVITLVDMKPLFGSGDLHWGLIHAFNEQGVTMASWHQVFQFSWAQFAQGWHCKGWVYPNNFYALYVTP